MALARVVSFTGVDSNRMDEMKNEIEGQDPPEGLNPSDIMILHDPDSQESLAVLVFDNEDDYSSGDAILNAMPSDETPGQRTAVRKYNVALRRTR
jgi:hypothetical protein